MLPRSPKKLSCRKVSWLAPALALGAGLGLASPAEACSAPLCTPDGAQVPLPPTGPVPANLPALVLLPPPLNGTFATTPESAPRLLHEDGSAVATTFLAPSEGQPGYLLVPEAPLQPGETYTLEATGTCANPKAQHALQRSFTAGAAQPLPSSTGRLEVGGTGWGTVEVAHPSLCSTPIDTGYTQLRFTPDPALVPFLPWVHWTLEVDGNLWARARHGSMLADGTLAPPSWHERQYGYRRLFVVYAECGTSDEQLFDRGLPPGPHRATLRPVLAHAPGALPPLEVDFELSCPRGGGVAPQPPVADTPHLFGCSHASGPGFLALLGLLALGWRRRQS